MPSLQHLSLDQHAAMGHNDTVKSPRGFLIQMLRILNLLHFGNLCRKGRSKPLEYVSPVMANENLLRILPEKLVLNTIRNPPDGNFLFHTLSPSLCSTYPVSSMMSPDGPHSFVNTMTAARKDLTSVKRKAKKSPGPSFPAGCNPFVFRTAEEARASPGAFAAAVVVKEESGKEPREGWKPMGAPLTTAVSPAGESIHCPMTPSVQVTAIDPFRSPMSMMVPMRKEQQLHKCWMNNGFMRACLANKRPRTHLICMVTEELFSSWNFESDNYRTQKKIKKKDKFMPVRVAFFNMIIHGTPPSNRILEHCAKEFRELTGQGFDESINEDVLCSWRLRDVVDLNKDIFPHKLVLDSKCERSPIPFSFPEKPMRRIEMDPFNEDPKKIPHLLLSTDPKPEHLAFLEKQNKLRDKVATFTKPKNRKRMFDAPLNRYTRPKLEEKAVKIVRRGISMMAFANTSDSSKPVRSPLMSADLW